MNGYYDDRNSAGGGGLIIFILLACIVVMIAIFIFLYGIIWTIKKTFAWSKQQKWTPYPNLNGLMGTIVATALFIATSLSIGVLIDSFHPLGSSLGVIGPRSASLGLLDSLVSIIMIPYDLFVYLAIFGVGIPEMLAENAYILDRIYDDFGWEKSNNKYFGSLFLLFLYGSTFLVIMYLEFQFVRFIIIHVIGFFKWVFQKDQPTTSTDRRKLFREMNPFKG